MQPWSVVVSRELHPEAKAVLDRIEGANAPPVRELSVDGARRQLKEQFASPEPEPVADVTDHTLDGPGGDLPVRVYEPESEAETLPVLVWFHGGGFVLGDIETADPTCRVVANAAESVVVSVDYRLAPEHPFPAGVEDCYFATEWAVRNAEALGGDPERVGIGGTSAGATLTAAVALMARDRTESPAFEDGPELAYQWLVYPATNVREEYPSYDENGEGYFLERDDSEWFKDHYLPQDSLRFHPYAYPMEAQSVADLPPATVLTAEFDPLRDEGVAYAERLEDAGGDVVHRHYEGMIHGFFSMVGLSRARDAIDAVAADFQEAI